MMNKAQKLLNPLSMTLRRTIASISHLSPYNSSSLDPSFYVPSPSFVETSSRVLLSPRRSFLRDSKVSGKCFCSESAEKISARCWNCNAASQTAPFLFCESCRSIQPVDHSVDYFQIFGLEKTYKVEVDNLDGKYKDWQKKLHPDLVHSKPEKEREYAAEQSARVIDAYRTITDPLSRAKYVMKLDGIDINEEETISEPELLAEIMEIREAVEEAADSQALKQIQSQMQEKMKHWSDSFANAFENRNLDEALTCIQRMTYYERVTEEIVKKL